MYDKLLIVAQETVFQNRYSAHEISEAIDKKYSTLMRECNPYDKLAKLGVVTLFKIMIFTRNIEPLRYMAHCLGYKLIPVDATMQ